MSIGLYTITTRAAGSVLTASIYNADHQNHVTNQNPEETGAYSDNVTQMQLQTSPGAIGSEVLAPNLATELSNLRYVLAYIMGTTYWYDTAHAVAGNVRGPGEATEGDIPMFSDTTGHNLSDGYTVGTSANNLVQLNGSAQLPAVSGALLTNLPVPPPALVFTAPLSGIA